MIRNTATCALATAILGCSTTSDTVEFVSSPQATAPHEAPSANEHRPASMTGTTQPRIPRSPVERPPALGWTSVNRSGAWDPEHLAKKISVDFRDTSLAQVFHILAEVADINIVLAPDVTGKVTLLLVDVQWNQVIELVARTAGLVIEKNERVWIVRNLN